MPGYENASHVSVLRCVSHATYIVWGLQQVVSLVAAAEAETAELRREAHAATLAALKVMCEGDNRV